MKNKFTLNTELKPAGDQPKAISSILKGLEKGMKKQTLLGVTGSGKTFTMANVISKINKPTLVIAHNKTLAAQLAAEFKEFFPENSVHYFVSYYDYYQPEAYMPTTDTYIEKDAQINKEIDRLRHASTQSLLTRNDVIIVASVSCIYGLGSPEEYREENFQIKKGEKIARNDILSRLIKIHFERTNADLTPGTFRALGDRVEIMPVSENFTYSLEIEKDKVVKILAIDPVTSKIIREEESIFVFPAKHFITNKKKLDSAIKEIKKELGSQLKKFEKEGKLLESERLKRRTNYDIAMLREVGYCSGIENYSRIISGKKEGEAPETLISYFGKDFLTVIDESHVTLPQLRAMYAGDQSRKNTLVEHGFRLPSAKDNRPLRYEEFEKRIGQVVYVSATPSDVEKKESEQIVEQVIRPTGLIDPEIEVHPILPSKKYEGQVQDFIKEATKVIKENSRVLATTLTKKMAEDLSSYLKEKGFKAEYLHSDVETLDRIKILTRLRKGEVDCLVGVNLLREGLDLPEVKLIGILDADKEGFLRSETSLVQTIGRAARNSLGRVILYADKITNSMQKAIDETDRRRHIQKAFNKKNGITPKTIIKKIRDITEELDSMHEKAVASELALDAKLFEKNPNKLIKLKERQMTEAVKDLDFETAAILRDEIKILKDKINK